MNPTVCLAAKTTATISKHSIGPKAFAVEPLLILGSAMMWLAILPFAGLLWFGDWATGEIRTRP